MSVLPIRKYGDPVLRKKCETVKDITPQVRKLIADMIETLHSVPGVGLAANQVGVPVRISVIDIDREGKHPPLVLINPRIVTQSGAVEDEEGCLSLPGLAAVVKRFQKVRVEAVNEKGFPVVIDGTELLGRALQHELDHLDGKIFIDRLPFFARRKIEQEAKRKKKAGEW